MTVLVDDPMANVCSFCTNTVYAIPALCWRIDLTCLRRWRVATGGWWAAPLLRSGTFLCTGMADSKTVVLLRSVAGEVRQRRADLLLPDVAPLRSWRSGCYDLQIE